MPVFLYDISGSARIAIEAASDEVARRHLPHVEMFIAPTDESISDYNDGHSDYQVRRIQIDLDTTQAELVSIDGRQTEDLPYIQLAKAKGLEIREVAGGWRGQFDEDWVTDVHPTRAAVAREWCQEEGFEP